MQAPATPGAGGVVAPSPGARAPGAPPAGGAPSVPLPRAPRRAAAPKQVMPAAAAQRRLVWNAAMLLLLWVVPMVWGGAVDAYYDMLDFVDSMASEGTDELLDTVLLWARSACSVVFLFNIAEAFLAGHKAQQVAAAPRGSEPTPVGQAFARAVSRSSPGTRGDKDGGWARPALPPSRTSPRTAGVPSPGRLGTPLGTPRSASPFSARGASASLGKGRPGSSPFRAASGAVPRTPSSVHSASPSPFARSVSRSPGRGFSPSSARTELDEALEVEQALQELSTAS